MAEAKPDFDLLFCRIVLTQPELDGKGRKRKTGLVLHTLLIPENASNLVREKMLRQKIEVIRIPMHILAWPEISAKQGMRRKKD